MAKKIGRPKKVRFIQQMPPTMLFSPRGRPGRPEIVDLTLDQFEAFKMSDHQGFSQSQGAVAMNIARSSFGRILREARAKIADALVNGKIIRITFGEAQIGVRKAELSPATLAEELSKFKNRNKSIARQFEEMLGDSQVAGRDQSVEGIKTAMRKKGERKAMAGFEGA